MSPMEELLNLGLGKGSGASAPYSNAGFTLRRKVIEHPEFARAIREIARIHDRAVTSGVAEGLLLVGQTGSGKTTILDYYAQRFPRKRLKTHVEVPVPKVVTPEGPTVKSLAEAVLLALGDPMASKGTATAKTDRIVYFVDQCRVQLLAFDEFQHFHDGHRVAESKRVSDWLKNLMQRTGKPIVLCGLPRSIAILNSNPQLRRRFKAPHYIEPFGFATESEQTLFRAILAQLQELLPEGCIALSEPETARRFYYATHGLMDYVIKILDDAASRPGSGPAGAISMPDLAAAFKRTIWDAAPDALNPFLTGAKLRHLDQAREPFDVWDDPTQYTLSKRAAKLVGKSRSKGDGHASAAP